MMSEGFSILLSADADGIISLFAQLGSMVFAGVIGRFLLQSRLFILIVSLLGAFAAMVSNILIDGQGAFIYLFFTPFIYLAAVAGRSDLDTV